VARDVQPARVGDVPHSQADGTRLRELFPDVVPTDLDDGLAATVAWMRSVIPG
jgi:UDP-glucose 4-epimerase